MVEVIGGAQLPLPPVGIGVVPAGIEGVGDVGLSEVPGEAPIDSLFHYTGTISEMSIA